jgi:hypothetical protein
MSVIAILMQGLVRLREIGWTQGAYARHANGRMYRFDWRKEGDPGPASFSAQGAICGNDVLDMMHARDRLWRTLGARQAGFCSMAAWNDAPERTRAEVVALYEEAIRAVEATA